jgi:cation:H+ antiporter
VSLQAALAGSPDIALGNVIGSNIANIGLILGVTAFISPLSVDREFYTFTWPVMMLLSVVLYFMLKSGNVLDFYEGVGLFLSIIIFVIVLIKRSKKNAVVTIQEVDDTLQQVSSFKIFIWLLIGAFALYFGSEWLVFGAKEVAASFGVSERVISVTMVAVGTSVPELAASVIAALKQEKAISLGNLIGSNIFNIASVLGLTAMIHPINVINPNILSNDIFWMIGFAAILIPLMLLPVRYSFGRYKGLIKVAVYILFVYLAFSGDN